VNGEIIVAKRRNLKKEKASRNQAYARQFRKKSTRTFGGRRYSRSDNNGAASNGNESSNDSE